MEKCTSHASIKSALKNESVTLIFIFEHWNAYIESIEIIIYIFELRQVDIIVFFFVIRYVWFSTAVFYSIYSIRFMRKTYMIQLFLELMWIRLLCVCAMCIEGIADIRVVNFILLEY